MNDGHASNLIGQLEADLYERTLRLNRAERILRELGYERCTAAACNCSSYHRIAQAQVTRNLNEMQECARKLRKALDGQPLEVRSLASTIVNLATVSISMMNATVVKSEVTR